MLGSIACRSFVSIVCALAAPFVAAQASQPVVHDFPERAQSHLRYTRTLSFHPDGRRLLLVQCDTLIAIPDCFLYQLDLVDGSASRFQFSDDYVYRSAAYSPDGKQIVMTRASRLKPARVSLDENEIALMQADGTGLRPLVTGAEFKANPAISKDGRYVAYWKGALRPPGSRTLALGYDLWEQELATGHEHRFTSPHRFFQAGSIQYLAPDTLLADADTPVADLDGPEFSNNLTQFGKQNHNSGVYRFHRSDTAKAVPEFLGAESVTKASADRDGHLYFFGERPSLSVFAQSGSSDLRVWPFPKVEVSNILYMAVSPDGGRLAFTYTSPDHNIGEGLFAIGMFDFANGTWSSVDLPPAEDIKLIKVSRSR